MAFRATNPIKSDAYLQIKRAARNLKDTTDQYIAAVQTSNTDYGRLETIYVSMDRFIESTASLGAVPGMQAYAAEQENDPAYDFDAEFATMSAAVQGCADWISNGIPVVGRTLNPIDTWNGSTTIVADFFTPAQMTGLVNQLDAVTQSIS